MIQLVRFAACLVALMLLAPSTAAAQATCDPFQTPAQYREEVPRLAELTGFDFGEQEVTAAQINQYLYAVDRASDRVVTGLMGRSVQGRPIRYAIVGTPDRVTPAALAEIRGNARRLRDPDLSQARAEQILASQPAILWIAANVHGGEESGADAALRTLYELADRDDCAAQRILSRSIVVILPTQNPDGRELELRQNVYGFDLNRDWFARTQPETDAKLELLRRYPGQLFVDAHEMGSPTFFFPPNEDPIYHETTDTTVDWINNLYAPAVAAEFNRQGIKFFNRNRYDLFFQGYGDTVPSTGFLAAGMTYEKNNAEPIAQRTYEQWIAQWATLYAGGGAAESIVRRWREEYVTAQQQGEAGFLEPNEVIDPANPIVTEVPTDRVRHYFIRGDDPAKRAELQALVRRLQRMDVEVHRLAAPLEVPDFKPYGRARRATTLPAGTYWISMAQGQKHWIQAMLNEDPYTPFPYFYDVTGWSQPTLFNLEGGSSGAELEPRAKLVSLQRQPREALRVEGRKPRVTILRLDETATSSRESSGWLRWRLTTWGLPFRVIGPADVAAGALDQRTGVLLVPNGPVTSATQAMGAAGAQALRDWIRAGGRYVGWRAGAEIAATLGLTTAQLRAPENEIPGSMIRALVDTSSPLARGVGPELWVHYATDRVMTHPDPVVRFPTFGTEDFFVSGFEEDEEELSDTSVVVDERLGDGRVVVFSIEPNFRGYTTGSAKMLANAIVGPDPAASTTTRVRATRAAAARRAALALEHRTPAPGRP